MKKSFIAAMILFVNLLALTSYVHAQEAGPLEGISMNQAKEIALKHVKGKIIRAKVEKDDGITKYEIIIMSKNGKYEVEIDKSTGKVLEIEKEGSDHNGDNDKHENEDND